MATAKKTADGKQALDVSDEDQQHGGTQVTVRQIYVEPNDPFTIEHIANGWCQVASVAYVGGGDKRFLLTMLTFEPVTVRQARENHKDLPSGPPETLFSGDGPMFHQYPQAQFVGEPAPEAHTHAT